MALRTVLHTSGVLSMETSCGERSMEHTQEAEAACHPMQLRELVSKLKGYKRPGNTGSAESSCLGSMIPMSSIPSAQ